MVEFGYRDPLNYKKMDTIEALSLTNDVLAISKLVQENKNEYAHQYIYELKQGLNPRESKWFKNLERVN